MKIAIASLLGREERLLDLARGAVRTGGYVVDGDLIKGLIYAPAPAFLREDYGLDGEVFTDLRARALPAILARASFFVASVHHSVRWPENGPPHRGGHLVLITSADDESVTFHNPSGDRPENRENARLPLVTFDKFSRDGG